MILTHLHGLQGTHSVHHAQMDSTQTQELRPVHTVQMGGVPYLDLVVQPAQPTTTP